jgi:hypothetical protein
VIPHAIGGVVGIPSGNVDMVLLGLAVLRERQRVGIFSVVLVGAGLLAMPAGSLVVLAVGHGTGAAERVTNYPLIAWMVVLGVSLVRRS